MTLRTFIGLALAAVAATSAAPGQPVDIAGGSVVQKVLGLKPGQYVWAPSVAPAGPVLLIVNLKSQRALLYRNGVPIGATTVSTGRPGYATPTGVFTILQKHVEHYSRTYDNAPMPYMQRLTWRGVALHAGNLPGYPASHGCIRLPLGFAKLLYGATKLGMTVVIASEEALPRAAPSPDLAGDNSQAGSVATLSWHPELSPTGPVSIIVSAADKRAVVLRNGVEIGSAPVEVSGPVTGTWAYALRSIDSGHQNWIRVDLSGARAGSDAVPPEEWQRFTAAEDFRTAVAGIVGPGTTIVVTPDSLRAGATGTALTLIEEDPTRRK